MDRGAFDTLAQLVSSQRSRRSAIAAILGAALLRHDPAVVLGKGRGKGKVRAQAKTKAKAKAQSKPCYPGGTTCVPGKGRNTSGCDFSHSTALLEGNFRGANLSNSNFTGALLARADFRGANLSGSCLVGANLTGAKLGSSVNLGGAIFCRTLMSDGKVSDRDCDKATSCCPATPPLVCEECEGEDGCGRPGDTCGLFFPDCCPRYLCTPSFIPVYLTCQIPCAVDADCKYWGEGGKCQYDVNSCPFMDRCCVFPNPG
jgi:hypothetical protein